MQDSFFVSEEILKIIADVFQCSFSDIKNISSLKKGMTNRSFVFEVNSCKYIMRIPGEGTDLLINRKNEANVYDVIKHHDLCDELFYINSDKGYKITRFVKNARVCDPHCESDLQKCMEKLQAFHQMNLQVAHEFDLFGQIEFYESLCKKQTALWQPTFGDYEITKQNVFSLKEFIDSTNPQKCLTHIDAVPDNFLISQESDAEKIQLIDWEYAGMQDPLVDLAMFCVYALYDKKSQIDRLIDIYFSNKCSQINRLKIYCYISVCGLLWSNWCEYKKQLGVEFGEYSLRQYRFAKDYFVVARDEIKKLRGEM